MNLATVEIVKTASDAAELEVELRHLNESIDYRPPPCYHVPMFEHRKITETFSLSENIVLYPGDFWVIRIVDEDFLAAL